MPDDTLTNGLQPISQTDILPFDMAKQEAVMGYLLSHDSFFLKAIQHVQYYWFANVMLGAIWEKILSFYNQFKRRPTIEELKSEFACLSMEEANKYYTVIDRCIMMTKHYGLDVVQQQCTLWYRSVLIKEAAKNLEYHYNRKDIQSALEYVDAKFRQIRQADFDADQAISFMDTKNSIVKHAEDRRKNACTTGSSSFDRALLPSDRLSDGGLPAGDLTVVMAPVNRGKSSFMRTVAIYNLERNKDILYIVHEDHPDNVKQKILLCALGCTESDLVHWYADPAKFALVQEWERKLTEHFTFINMVRPGGTYIEDVLAKIQYLQIERKHQTGKGYDLLIDDYPAKLLTREHKKDELRIKMAFIYEQFANVAIAENLHALVAVQSNRAGAKASRNAERALGMEDVGEAWGITHIANTFITINRSEQDVSMNEIKFYIDKSRNNRTGQVVVCKSNLSCGRTHGPTDAHVFSEWELSARAAVNGDIIANGNGSPLSPVAKPIKPKTDANLAEIQAQKEKMMSEWEEREVKND